MRQFDWFFIELFGVVLLGFGLTASAQGPGFQLVGVGSASIPVTAEKMTNLIFPEAVQIGVKVSRNVLVQKVRGVENVIEVIAQRRGFPATNLSIYGKDGRLYSFVLRYVADSAVLNFRVVPEGRSAEIMLEGLPADLVRLRADADELTARRGFLHRRARVSGVRLRLSGVYLRDSLEWLVLGVSNLTAMPFRPDYARYFGEDRKQVKRKAVQELAVHPVYDTLPGEVGGEQEVRFAVGFRPFTVGRDKRLVVELAGADGRSLRLDVREKELLKAKAE